MNDTAADEKTVSGVLMQLYSAVGRLEERVFGPKVGLEGEKNSVPQPNSKARQLITGIEEITKRVQKVADELPL